MAGHSKFKNIQHRKGAQDAKRAKIFTKIGREIIVAAKLGGPDPSSNPRLRAAITAGRAQDMPNDRIKRAIDFRQWALATPITMTACVMKDTAPVVLPSLWRL